MGDKIALTGFDRVQLFPVIKNDYSNYEVGPGFSVENIKEMTRESDVSSTKIYADDKLYLDLKQWNGMNVTLTTIEMKLELLAKLGFGEYDETKKTLKLDYQGKNLQFAISFRQRQADGNYRMTKMYVFTVNEIKESAAKTSGANTEVGDYQIIGTFTGRTIDDVPGTMKISESAADFSWLNTIESSEV